jgi:ankyrin repeat protein
MPRSLTPDLSLDGLKKDAKRWLKAIRANDPDARDRFARALTGGSLSPTLREVQLALAREFGFEGWTALKHALADRAMAPRASLVSFDDAVLLFLDNACPDHHVRGGSDHVRAEHTALRLLDRYPEIAKASLYTSVVCGDLDAVTNALAADPGWARRKSPESGTARTEAGGEGDLVKHKWGSKGWEPLSYLCFTRLSLPAVTEHAVAIARALLDAGADPNVYFMAGSSHYTPLTGAIGEGEEGRRAHQQRDALVALLLERGANPYDGQVVYNIHFAGKALWFLKTIYEHALRTGRAADWADPEWQMLNAGSYGTGARWFLETAVEHNDVELAEWCLGHGANPNSAPGPGRRNRQRPLYEEAVFRGHTAVAEALVRYGATRSAAPRRPADALIAACLRQDEAAIREEIRIRPELLDAHEPLWAAAKYNRREAVRVLLDLGVSPNIQSPQGESALHIAAYDDAVEVGGLLIERGAEVDAIGRQYQNTPLGGAVHCQSRRMIDLLVRHSKSAWEVGYSGHVDRLREILAERPELARGYDGETLLMYLPPDDEDKALETATLLLQHGADPTIKDPNGLTAADRAERNAMYRVAAALREAERRYPASIRRSRSSAR